MLERVEQPVIAETVRSAVISLIEHDDNIMRKILDIVTKELVLRLTADPHFTEQIAKQITDTDIVNEMKQELYASCSLVQATSADNLDAIGLYRDVWIAAIASSRKSLATQTAAICVRFHGRRVRHVYVTMQITFLARKSALIYRRGLRQRVASLTIDCNGVFAIRAYGTPRRKTGARQQRATQRARHARAIFTTKLPSPARRAGNSSRHYCRRTGGLRTQSLVS